LQSEKADKRPIKRWEKCANFNVADGLHNGARGTLAKVKMPEGGIQAGALTRGRRRQVIDLREPLMSSFSSKIPKVGAMGEGEMVDDHRAVLEQALKVQGLTLPKVVADCGPGIFLGGMGYTAISRVRSLEDLVLLDYLPEAFRCNPKAEKEEGKLKQFREGIQEDPFLVG
jgi:hypothetical protein